MNLAAYLTDSNFTLNVLKININVVRNFILKQTFNNDILIDRYYKESYAK